MRLTEPGHDRTVWKQVAGGFCQAVGGADRATERRKGPSTIAHAIADHPNANRANILIVEDEFIIALDLQHALEDVGYGVLGPHENVADSLECLAAGAKPDVAILDVQLNGEDVTMLAEQLRLREVPIIFHSGHAKPCDLEERFPGSFFCGKPCTQQRLQETIEAALAP